MSHGARDQRYNDIARTGQVFAIVTLLVVISFVSGISTLVINPHRSAVNSAPGAQTTTGFDDSWSISQAGFRGIANGTLNGNVFQARMYNVISTNSGTYGPWGYSVIQKGLLDWGPATSDHLNGTLLSVTVKFNAAAAANSTFDWHVYIGVYYHLTQPVTVNCGGTPTTRQFLDAQIQLARAQPPEAELCATGTAVLSSLQQNLVSLGQTFTLSNYNITQHFLDQARAIGLPSNVGYTEYSLEPGIEGYGISVLSADFSNLSLTSPSHPLLPLQRKMPLVDMVAQPLGYNSSLLSTSHPHEVIIAAVYCYTDSGIEPSCLRRSPSVTDTGGLVFNLHYSYCSTGSRSNSCIWDYYAIVQGLLVNDTVTVPGFRTIIFSVSNVDTSNIFDPNLPVGQHCVWLDNIGPSNYPDPATAPSCALNYSTGDPHSLVFEMTTLFDGYACANTNSGHDWTLLNGNSWGEVNVKSGNGNSSFTCGFDHTPVVEMVDGLQGIFGPVA